METPLNLTEIREVLRQGDTGKALQLFCFLLENASQYPEALRTVRVLESNYAAVRGQELKGILTFSEAQKEYNKINDSLLALLENPAAAAQKVLPQPFWQRRSFLWAAGGALLLLFGLSYFLIFRENICPDFDASKKWKIMVVPFQNVGTVAARPALVFQNSIRTLTKKNDLSADVKVATKAEGKRELPDLDEAARVGKDCGADLIVWGQYSAGADSIRLNVQYKFTDDGREGDIAGLALRDLTALNSGKMVKSLDDAVLSLCGMLAMREKRPELAAKWFNKVKEKDATDVAMLEILEKNKAKN